MSREAMDFDVLIVGGGPAGLSAAIRLKQLAAENGCPVSVCLIEKSAEVGGHILSGTILDPRALDELFPDWRALGAPVNAPVSDDRFLLLGARRGVALMRRAMPLVRLFERIGRRLAGRKAETAPAPAAEAG